MPAEEEQQFPVYDYPLKFEVLHKCSKSKARCSTLTLPHATLQTPQFMPVGTQGALKGVLPEQIKDLNCNLILGNTYHLGHRPVGTFLIFQIVLTTFLGKLFQ
jgi:tRNA-guanine family transglycosylase